MLFLHATKMLLNQKFYQSKPVCDSVPIVQVPLAQFHHQKKVKQTFSLLQTANLYFTIVGSYSKIQCFVLRMTVSLPSF